MSGPDWPDPMAFWTAMHLAGREHEAVDALHDFAARGDHEDAEDALVLLPIGLLALDRADEAAHYAAALASMHPENWEARGTLARCLLTAGRWPEALPLVERARRRYSFELPVSLTALRWNEGMEVPSELLVVCGEGDGDVIMLSRYASALAERGCQVTFAAEGRLLPVLRRVPGTHAAVDLQELDDIGTPWAPVQSLPGLLSATVETVPSPDGYLTVDGRRAGLWQHMLPPTALRVGLCWGCSLDHGAPEERSMPTEALAPLLSLPGVGWVNLQVGPLNGQGDAAGIMCNPAGALRDYGQTAELISQLDLVVTVDTSVAHVAGALGKPVWIMLPRPAEWRWGVGTSSSPWYSSARLFRQHRMGEWEGVVGDVAHALKRTSPPPSSTVSSNLRGGSERLGPSGQDHPRTIAPVSLQC